LIDYSYYKQKIRRHFPDYNFSWEIFTNLIIGNLKTKPYWLDIGAGSNFLIREQPGAEFAVGTDIRPPDDLSAKDKTAYCMASAYMIPFKDSSFDFVTSRYTFEHLADPKSALIEIGRVLKPGGVFIMQTTNKSSPLLLISRLIPFPIKRRLIKLLFKDNPSGTFKTFYRYNTPAAVSDRIGLLKLDSVILIEDIMCHSRFLFFFSFAWYKLIRFFGIDFLSNNIIAIYRKPGY
jgi:SAM-dependent methyltransferase